MISKQLYIFIEYPIKETVIHQYEHTMKKVLQILQELGAEDIKWTKWSYQKGSTVYTERFILPTESHYFALKELRCSGRYSIFDELAECIDTNAGNVQYVGLKITS